MLVNIGLGSRMGHSWLHNDITMLLAHRLAFPRQCRCALAATWQMHPTQQVPQGVILGGAIKVAICLACQAPGTTLAMLPVVMPWRMAVTRRQQLPALSLPMGPGWPMLRQSQVGDLVSNKLCCMLPQGEVWCTEPGHSMYLPSGCT